MTITASCILIINALLNAPCYSKEAFGHDVNHALISSHLSTSLFTKSKTSERKKIFDSIPQQISQVSDLKKFCNRPFLGKACYSINGCEFWPSITHSRVNSIAYRDKKGQEQSYQGKYWNESPKTIIRVSHQLVTSQRFSEVDFIPKGCKKYAYVVFTPDNMYYVDFLRHSFIIFRRHYNNDSENS